MLPSNIQLEMVIFLKPPLDSVPSLMLPLNSFGKNWPGERLLVFVSGFT